MSDTAGISGTDLDYDGPPVLLLLVIKLLRLLNQSYDEGKSLDGYGNPSMDP